MYKNKIITLVLTFIFIFSLTAISWGASEKQAPELQEMVDEGELEPLEERLPEEPLEMDPVEATGEYGGTWNRATNSEDFAHFLMSMYGHSWVRFIEDGADIAPNLATDWESNDDATVWTFHFREGVKWSDGEPFTVDDIMFWWEEMATNDDFAADTVPNEFQAGGETAELTKVDDYTLEIEFAESNPLFPEQMATWPNRGSSNVGLGATLVAPEHYFKEYHPEYNDEYDNYEDLEEKMDWWLDPGSPTLTAWRPVDYSAGEYVHWERNPYYWAVDDKGNQLPYIEKVEDEYISDKETFTLKASDGEMDMQIRPPLLNIEDVSMLKENEESNNFRTLMWDSGSGSGPLFIPNRNHPEEDKRELYRNPQFLRAISHAINRERINKMVYYDSGEPTTGTLSPKTPEFKTDKGSEIYEEWKDLAVEHDLEKAEEMLDEIGVVDEDNDGWREMPNGDDLTLRIDADAESPDEYIQTNELVKENWEEIGLETIINTVDPSELTTMVQDAEFDIRDSWEIGDGHPLLYPGWIVPVMNDHWAPLYGSYYNIKGTSQEGVDEDKDPRDRSPVWEKPEEGGPVDQLQKTLDEAQVTVDKEERTELIYDIFNIHIENGPFIIGTVGNAPRVGVAKDHMVNVPEKDDLPTGGFINPWIVSYPAIINPPTFWMDK